MVNNHGILVADVSSFQVDQYHVNSSINNLARKLYRLGVRGLMIKLTQGAPECGYAYENKYAAAQYRAWANVMSNHGHADPQVGFYNYLYGANGAANARYFIGWLKAFGMSKNTAVSADMEDPTVPGTYEANEWIKTMKDAGYKNRSIYSMADWFNSGRLNTYKIQCNSFWVAAYSSMPPTLVESKYYSTAWQFSDDYDGMSVDMSLDYDHVLVPKVSAQKRNPKKPAKPKSHTDSKAVPNKGKKDVKHDTKTNPKNNKPKAKPETKKAPAPKHDTKKPEAKKGIPAYAKFSGEYQAKFDLNIFIDSKLTKKADVMKKGCKFNAQPVCEGDATRLMLNSGDYVSGNLDFVKRVF